MSSPWWEIASISASTAKQCNALRDLPAGQHRQGIFHCRPSVWLARLIQLDCWSDARSTTGVTALPSRSRDHQADAGELRWLLGPEPAFRKSPSALSVTYSMVRTTPRRVSVDYRIWHEKPGRPPYPSHRCQTCCWTRCRVPSWPIPQGCCAAPMSLLQIRSGALVILWPL